MFSRNNQQLKTPSPIPSEVLKSINSLINETFEKSLMNKGLELETYGEIYENEIILIFSLVQTKDKSLNTISLFISDDLTPETKIEKKINYLINSSSEFFEILTNSSTSDTNEIYSPRWQKTELEGDNFFYKISRENIKLTIEANKLLEKN